MYDFAMYHVGMYDVTFSAHQQPDDRGHVHDRWHTLSRFRRRLWCRRSRRSRRLRRPRQLWRPVIQASRRAPVEASSPIFKKFVAEIQIWQGDCFLSAFVRFKVVEWRNLLRKVLLQTFARSGCRVTPAVQSCNVFVVTWSQPKEILRFCVVTNDCHCLRTKAAA